ncbi:hypothetical protein [Nocardia sp. alder85J]|uniref:hypothetical protein n=1 Tax=Nocardia sp. alder85J TaxID=2862949 RepID=UPI001CD25512|nr:hypothetical protein [Nocardia sp. alder85J]MCX4094123.1 hypothetical protein [Nocardia sp. alder85J]
MVDVTAARLRELTGPDPYRDNAFRLVNMATDADRRSLRDRRRVVLAALAAGADTDLGHPLDADRARAAFDLLLGDPRRRIADEALWLWGTPPGACGCDPEVHAAHDAAVSAHRFALGECETPGTSTAVHWREAARSWDAALRGDGFAGHIRHRVLTLDDPRLDESVLGVLLDELPLVLVKPLLALIVSHPGLQQDLYDVVHDWPMPPGVRERLLGELAVPVRDEASAALDAAYELFELGDFRTAAQRVDTLIGPAVRQLEALLPAARHPRTGVVRDRAAALLGKCAQRIVARSPGAQQVSGLPQRRDNLGQAARWLRAALELAADPGGAETLRAQLAGIDIELTEIGRTLDRLAMPAHPMPLATEPSRRPSTLPPVGRQRGPVVVARRWPRVTDLSPVRPAMVIVGLTVILGFSILLFARCAAPQSDHRSLPTPPAGRSVTRVAVPDQATGYAAAAPGRAS